MGAGNIRLAKTDTAVQLPGTNRQLVRYEVESGDEGNLSQRVKEWPEIEDVPNFYEEFSNGRYGSPSLVDIRVKKDFGAARPGYPVNLDNNPTTAEYLRIYDLNSLAGGVAYSGYSKMMGGSTSGCPIIQFYTFRTEEENRTDLVKQYWSGEGRDQPSIGSVRGPLMQKGGRIAQTDLDDNGFSDIAVQKITMKPYSTTASRGVIDGYITYRGAYSIFLNFGQNEEPPATVDIPPQKIKS